jgi:uncharacterized protein
MEEPTQSLAGEIDALREAYAALNRNDIEGFVKPFDTQIAWIEPDHYPGGGTTKGLAAVKALLTRSRATWAEGTCDAERFVAGGDKIVVFIHVRVRLKDRTEWIEARHASVYTFRDGKAVEMRIFDETRDAPDWVGVEA